jgi:hypothetical protein
MHETVQADTCVHLMVTGLATGPCEGRPNGVGILD